MHSFRELLIGTLIFTTRLRISCGQNGATTNGSYPAESTIPAEMKITSWNDMPFSGLTMENGTWVGKGYAFYLLDLLSSKLNFTYTIVPPEQHVLGDKQKGILNLLYEKKVDMAVAFLPILPELRKLCTFSIALDQGELTALMKRPQESATGSGLLAPFDTTVWLLVLASVISVGPIIYIFARFRAKLWGDPNSENYGLFAYMWFVYSSLLKQGTTKVATTDSTRILYATWWIFILILTSFYTANLTAFLTRPQFTLPINSLSDIVRKGYHWVTHEGRTIDYLVTQYHLDEMTLLNTTRRRGHYITAYEDPVDDIFNAVDRNRLFLGETHYLQTLLFENYVNKTRLNLEEPKKCTYVIMPSTILITNKAFAFPVGSPLKETINKELMILLETGIVKRTKLKDLPLAEVCPVDLLRWSTERQLTNTDLSLTYKVVIAGYAIASAIFFAEVTTRCSTNMYRRWKATGKCCNCTKSKRQSKKAATPELIFATKGRLLDSRISLQKRSVQLQPPYQNVPQNFVRGKKHSINGRDYYVVIDRGGDRRLIPIRTPSAFLFHYAA